MPADNQGHPISKPGRRRTRLDTLSIAVVAVALVLAAFKFVPFVRFPVLFALGKSPVCPYDLALKSGEMIHGHTARMNEIAASSRLIKSDDQGYELWDADRGQYWIPKGELKTLASILAEEDHQIYGSGEWGVQPGDVVLDCGAHIGAYSRRALDAGAKLVVSIEPSPTNRVALERNLAKEMEAGRVIVVDKGVWSEPGKLPFLISAESSAASSVISRHDAGEHTGHGHGTGHGDGTVIEVPLVTIDALVAELGLEKVDVIKMDIEGAEQNALRGARSTLQNLRPRLAIASYHVTDDQFRIPEIVLAAQNEYQMRCGPCGERNLEILPQTLLFR
jgi:FkbM family methyltransferase